MKSVIITGASGLLGQYLCKYFLNDYRVIGLYNSTKPNLTNIELVKVDLTKSFDVKNIIHSYSPQFLIHTAGFTSVDECELYPEIAHLQNVSCTKNICDAIKGKEIKLIQISTDHLFSGTKANYSEDSQVEPLNVYAETKLLAEAEALKINNSIIVRTNFYGGHTEKKMSFSSWIFKELSQGKKINMFNDVFFTPISICSLAENINLLMNSELTGIYNVVGAERLSKYDYAIKLADILNLPKELILKSTIDNLNLKAKRPRDMSLSISKITRELKEFKPEVVNEGLTKINKFNLI